MGMSQKMPEAFKAGRRTRREMPYSVDRLEKIAAWAKETGYELIASEEERQLYKKRMGWTMPPAFVEVVREKDRLILETWVRADAYLVLALFTRREPEMRLDRGGLTASFPRARARKQLNVLLARLNQPRIV